MIVPLLWPDWLDIRLPYQLRWEAVLNNRELFIDGLVLALKMAALGLAIGSVIGLVCAFLRASGNRVAGAVVTAYVELIRNVPLLLLVFMLHFGLPQAFPRRSAASPPATCTRSRPTGTSRSWFGSTPRSIMALFATQGTFIGVIGTALGVLLALLIAWQLGGLVSLLQGWLGVDLLSAEVYYLSELPTQVRPLEVAQIGGLALALAVAATFYPALSAARQPPAEALRYE